MNLSDVSSIITVLLFLWGIVKFVITPIRYNRNIRQLCMQGSKEIQLGNVKQGRLNLEKAIEYPKAFFTMKNRLWAIFNYAESFQEGDRASLENLKKAEANYSRISDFLQSKSKLYKFIFKYTFNIYLQMCVNQVDLLNKMYKHTQNDALLLSAIAYGENAIGNLSNKALIALVKSTVATTYRILAEKTGDVNQLNKSILYSEDSLSYYESVEDTLNIIRLHNNLGNSYSFLCFEFDNSGNGTRLENYKAARSHFYAAVNQCPFTVYPEQYARNYMNLGVLIYKYVASTNESDPDCLFEAKEDLSNALNIYTLSEFPFEYACCEMNLLLITSYQGILCSREELICDALRHGENALFVFTSQSYPSYNIKLHILMGNTYDYLADIVHNKKTDSPNNLSFFDCCVKALYHLEFIALEQSDPVDVLQTIAKMMTLSIDILHTEPISHENEIKYQVAYKKYQQKFSEIAEACPEALVQFKQNTPPIPEGAELIGDLI